MAFDSENKRLGKLVEECTSVVKEAEPKYWKRTHFVFDMHWRPLDDLRSRKMFRPKQSTRERFDEDFSDDCLSQVSSCRLSHQCVQYVFAPPGKRYFATHQLLLSYAYRLNCPQTTKFWIDLKRNEKTLCGSIHNEVMRRID